MGADHDAWRYPGDAATLAALMADEAIKQTLDSGRVLRQRNSMRTRLLSGAVMVEPDVLPHLAAAIDRLAKTFPSVGAVECFVYNANDVNAFVTAGRTRTLIAVASAAVNHFSTSELEFIIGHELGHALFGHIDITATHLLDDGHLMPASTMRLRAWQRAAEISADRAGLMLCGSVDAAAHALFKAASGIVAQGVTLSPGRFAGQWQHLLHEIVEDGERDFWQISHPFPPLRMQAMLLFWEAQQTGTEAALHDANAAIARMLAMMDPTAGQQTLNDPLLMAFFFWGGLYVALADGELDPREITRLESVVPAGIDCAAAIQSGRENASACKDLFTQSHRSRRKKFSAVELHRIVYGLIDVASADGRVSAEELSKLHELTSILGITERACDLIVSQYQRETGHEN